MELDQRGIAHAYFFWIAALMFGLPLLTSYYYVQTISNFATSILVPYILLVAAIGFIIWRLKAGGSTDLKRFDDRHRDKTDVGKAGNRSYFLAFVAVILATLAVASFGAMKYFLAKAYPLPSAQADFFGGAYLLFISLGVAIGFPVLLYLVFPTFRASVSGDRKEILLAALIGAVYFVTYLVLVNQIVVTGYNTPPGNYVASPVGTYPYIHVFTAGPPPSAGAESLVYVPMALFQLNQYFNFIIQPFEIIFGILLSTLVAVTIVVTRMLIGGASGHSCYTGAAVSGLGGFIGFTATCPTCLVPTMISVLFGGFSSVASVQLLYSNLFGVLVPPVVSIVALLASLLLLNNRGVNLNRPASSHRQHRTQVANT